MWRRWEAAHRKQIELITKIVGAMRYVTVLAAATVPHGRLLVAAAYILIGGYAVLSGGDYWKRRV